MAKRDRNINSSAIEQRIAEGRGKGTGASYDPWLHVQDVATDGRAWRIKGWKTGRDHHLLSDHEHDYFLIAHWSQKVVDIREQFPLPLETTLEIAKKIGVDHPADRRKNPVVMTTDFLVTVSTPAGNVDWARAIKPSSQLQKPRVIEKLEIERIYWQTNHISWVCWLLVASVSQNWPVRTSHHISCSLPISQRKSTISSMYLLIFTKGEWTLC